MADQPQRTLAERIAEDYAEAWRPEQAGDTLVGTLTEISVGKSDYGDYPIITVKTVTGERRSVHAFHQVLQDSLIEQAPKFGEDIAIAYRGRRLPKNFEPKKGSTPEGNLKDFGYEDYRVLVDREPVDVWGSFTKKTRDND